MASIGDRLDLPATLKEAQAITEQIRSGLLTMWDGLRQAHQRRAWETLGYASFGAYWNDVVDTTYLKIPVAERSDIVAALRAEGMSTRAIATATGLSKGTVGRELAAAPDGAPDRVQGVDGRSYRSTRSPQSWEGAVSAALADIGVAAEVAERIEDPAVKATALRAVADTAHLVAEVAAVHITGMEQLIEEAS